MKKEIVDLADFEEANRAVWAKVTGASKYASLADLSAISHGKALRLAFDTIDEARKAEVTVRAAVVKYHPAKKVSRRGLAVYVTWKSSENHGAE